MLSQTGFPDRIHLRHTCKGHKTIILGLAWSPDGKILASCALDGTVRLWNPAAGTALGLLEGYTNYAFCLAWSPDSSTLAAGTQDGTIAFWDIETGQRKKILPGHNDFVHTLAWSPNGSVLASGSPDRTIRLWSPESGDLSAVFTGHDDYVRSLAWSPDGKRLASGSRDKTVRLWHPELGVTAILEEASAGVVCLSWSSGRELAAGTEDGRILLMEIDSANRRSLAAHPAAITSLAFSYDGTVLASRSRDGTIRLWTCPALDPAGNLDEPHSGHFFAGLVFSPTEPALAALGKGDTVIRIWTLERR